ncbi:6-bladed beta-propeller [Phocaeicola massiliensis]|uniref:6-bladed beta-propeller n=2 Tax=Phocaeicola massiliensis TaxID=204516 RepID=UPI001F3763CC|nr:6-bladed beta-propeller [Phocaeicola massiliensis]
MNMKYLFSFLCLCCVLSVSAQKPVVINLAKAISESPKEIMLNELASDIRYVPLETTDDCLMNNEFYIMQYTGEDIITSGIFHFDKNGKFLNKIGSKGQGPEEYLQDLFAFGDWKNKLLYVQNWTTLTCYGFDGTFVRSIPTPQLNMGAAGLFDENHILYSNDIYYADKANPIQLYMVDSQNGKTVSKWRGHLEENKKYGMILTSRDFMYNYDNSLFYKPALENVIFKILSPKKRQLVYKFDCSGKDIDVSADEVDPKKRFQFLSVYWAKETAQYLFVNYGMKNISRLGIYDKEKKTFTNVTIKDNLAGGYDIHPAWTSDDNHLLMVYYAGGLLQDKEKRYSTGLLPERKKELDELLKNIKEDDNPVVILVTLKPKKDNKQ